MSFALVTVRLPVNHMRGARQIVCYGTVWVCPSDASGEIIPQRGPNALTPTFSTPGLDSSFISNCYWIIQGTTFGAVVTNWDQLTEGAPASGIRRIAGSSHRSSRTYHLYEFTSELCQRLATLSAERIDAIARTWYALRGVSSQPGETAAQVQHRADVISQLAVLASDAVSRDARLILRVDYRTRRSAAAA
jgi:hypothetical protein